MLRLVSNAAGLVLACVVGAPRPPRVVTGRVVSANVHRDRATLVGEAAGHAGALNEHAHDWRQSP